MNNTSPKPLNSEPLSKPSFNKTLKDSIRKPLLNPVTHILLQTLAFQFSMRPSLKKYLKGVDGWINFIIGFKTNSGSVNQGISFQDGKVKVLRSVPDNADLVLSFINEDALIELFRLPPNEALNLVLKNKIVLEGSLAYLQVFNFYVSLIMGNKHQKMLSKSQQQDQQARQDTYGGESAGLAKEFKARPQYRMQYPNAHAEKPDQGVLFLEDPYLPEYSLADFPRLKGFLDDHFSHKAEVCAERAKLLTHYFRKHGFESCVDPSVGTEKLSSEVRQASAFKYVMTHKKPIIRTHDLLAGTSSSNPIAGSVVYPDAQGVMIWGELLSIDKRSLIPFDISQETIDSLHFDIFPFWAKRNFNEWMRAHNDYPVCQKINERDRKSVV